MKRNKNLKKRKQKGPSIYLKEKRIMLNGVWKRINGLINAMIFKIN